MAGLLSGDVHKEVGRLLLFMPGALYVIAACVAPSRIAGVGRGGRLGSAQFVVLWSSLGGALYLGFREELGILPELLRNGVAFSFGFFAALVIIFRIQESPGVKAAKPSAPQVAGRGLET